MRGDFSIWRDERRQNFNGVLHQQGRVLLDADWNAQTVITNDWEDTAARDIIGSGIAGVPADAPNSFKVINVVAAGGAAVLTVAPGRVWADGLLAYLDASAPVTRIATNFEPPIQFPPAPLGAPGTRDAIVLEVWREEINGFQQPDLLIEPALGGPDTTERVHTEMAFRLFRLTNLTDTCESIIEGLKDNFATKGRLTVTLDAPPPPTGDCPLLAGSGYTGFEHNLYRIEIARATDPPKFKWSQFGGGLVGRGKLTNTSRTILITGNPQAIINSGLSQFYMEIVSFDSVQGRWQVTYGANVTLGSNGTLTLPNPATAGSPGVFLGGPPADGTVFFRLWNGIVLISDFNSLAPLQDGIQLQFDPASAGNYVAGDYWTFTVRAGEIPNITPLIDAKPPEGIHYHRVPLGIIEWMPAGPGVPVIEDCRHIFQPLTRLATCCTFRVGDGMRSHGDFRSIQAAIDALPASGGEVCVLPGEYHESVVIRHRRDITIKGCGRRTRVISPAGAGGGAANPVFYVDESQNIRILSLAAEAHNTGVGILLEGLPLEIIVSENGNLPLLNITLEDLLVRAATRSAVEVQFGYNIIIRGCRLEMKDVATGWPALFLIAEDSLIEENHIGIVDSRRIESFEVVSPLDPLLPQPVERALGGLQVGGRSERVRIINNVIAGGIGQGIRLGSLLRTVIKTGETVADPPPPDDDGTTRPSSAGALYEIRIERNRIFNMGLDGIGVVAFFDLGAADEFISVHRLDILGNEIRFCLNRPLTIPDEMIEQMGFGGISLADVDYLVIRDNLIEDNGISFVEPVCGIFILHGEGVEISRNRILNNGRRLPFTNPTKVSVKSGKRGGINIVYAVAPIVAFLLEDKLVPGQNGVPAIKIHDNIVSSPMGRALTLGALGPVSVVANQFTSRGVVSRGPEKTLLAATVGIINLGISFEIYSQFLSLARVMSGQVAVGGNLTGENFLVATPRAGLDDARLGEFIADGNVLFSNNQCVLDLAETGFDFALFSIVIVSLDDVAFTNNQCEASLVLDIASLQAGTFGGDFIFAQAFLFGLSLRVSDNRFKEGVFNAALSAITLGLFNTTTDNQSTHCLFIRGVPQLTVDDRNTSLANLFGKGNCDKLRSKRDAGQDDPGKNDPPNTQPGGPSQPTIAVLSP